MKRLTVILFLFSSTSYAQSNDDISKKIDSLTYKLQQQQNAINEISYNLAKANRLYSRGLTYIFCGGLISSAGISIVGSEQFQKDSHLSEDVGWILVIGGAAWAGVGYYYALSWPHWVGKAGRVQIDPSGVSLNF